MNDKEKSQPKKAQPRPWIQGTCANCGATGSILAKKRLCGSCAFSRRRSQVSEGGPAIVTTIEKFVPQKPIAPLDLHQTVILDFTEQPDMLNRLKAWAKSELRDPDKQVLWVLKDLIDWDKLKKRLGNA